MRQIKYFYSCPVAAQRLGPTGRFCTTGIRLHNGNSQIDPVVQSRVSLIPHASSISPALFVFGGARAVTERLAPVEICETGREPPTAIRYSLGHRQLHPVPSESSLDPNGSDEPLWLSSCGSSSLTPCVCGASRFLGPGPHEDVFIFDRAIEGRVGPFAHAISRSCPGPFPGALG